LQGIAPIFESGFGSASVDVKNLGQAKILIQTLASRGVTLIMTPTKDPSKRIVADLQRDRMKVTGSSELMGDFTALCRIQRVLRAGESFDLFRIIYGLKLPSESFNQLTQNQPPMWNLNLTKDKFELRYPGIVATAVALYR
jgi:hypothetical protein